MSVSAAQLLQHASRALELAGSPVTLAYAWRGAWPGGNSVEINGTPVRSTVCCSPLAVREALHAAAGQSQLLLIECDERKIGEDILARLFRHRLLHVDRWQVVADAYSVSQVDPRLYSFDWLADELLAASAKHASKPRTALSFDEATAICFERSLGFRADDLTLSELLGRLQERAAVWAGLPPEQQTLCGELLTQRHGDVIPFVLAAIQAGHGHAIVAIGLVCEVLYAQGAAAPQEIRDAVVRLESRLAGKKPPQEAGSRWAEAAVQATRERPQHQAQAECKLAEELLAQLSAKEFAHLSTVLPEGLHQRLLQLADAIKRFLRNPAALNEVGQASDAVESHKGSAQDHPGRNTARMIRRLCRWLAAAESLSDDEFVESFVTQEAWTDWARASLRSVQPEALAKATAKLLDQVERIRAERDSRFAVKLAAMAESGAVPQGTAPIETALDRWLAPLASESPVLMIVLDGMSWDSYLPIAMEMERSGWAGWRIENGPHTLLATVPTVTECSRASLLAGKLARGEAHAEKQAFGAHSGLRKCGSTKRPPVLLHKAELLDGHQLSDDACRFIEDTDQRVVAVVINAIDDALAKSDQLRLDWSLNSIPILSTVIAHARTAGRTVVITADHGHVLERHSELRPNGEGERWRLEGDPAADGEVRITGPRVTTLVGKPVVAPWSEAIRYGAKKNGYHGGVSRQELLVPIGVWTDGNEPAPGFEPHTIVPPDWWIEGGAESSPAPLQKPASRSAPAPTVGMDLFTQADAQQADWIEQLLGTPLLAQQRERAGRLALNDDRLRALLDYLSRAGDRASPNQLAAAIQMPAMRIRGVLSVLQRMLNVDGYPVISIEPGTGTVMLDRRLLKAQFDL